MVFRWCGREWNLALTDFAIGPKVLKRPPGSCTWDDLDLPAASELFLTVSLSVPHEGWCYKLVAAVVPLTDQQVAG